MALKKQNKKPEAGKMTQQVKTTHHLGLLAQTCSLEPTCAGCSGVHLQSTTSTRDEREEEGQKATVPTSLE